MCSELYEKAQRVMPGGVTAAARLSKYLNRPFFISKADGSRVYDLDGRPYIDMCTSFGASLLGHGHPVIVEALKKAGEMGIACGMEYPEAVELAGKISEAIPSAEMVRFTLSGTETTWYAARLARVYTGKPKIVKFEGHFHGYNDYLQYNYWPKPGEALPHIHEETPGFAPENSDRIIVLPFNDVEALEETVTREADSIAAIFLEPVNFNSGGILPEDGFLQALRDITRRNNILLVFDEILSGFRTGIGGAQEHFGVTPDITTLGKALGGGAPLSALVGKRPVMETVAPAGPMMHSGTYNANAVNVFCGSAFMDFVAQSGVYDELRERSRKLRDGLNSAFASAGLAARAHGLGARFGLLFGKAALSEPKRFSDVAEQDWNLAYAFFREALGRGVFFHSGWHHGISFVHGDNDLEQVLEVSEAAARAVADQG